MGIMGIMGINDLIRPIYTWMRLIPSELLDLEGAALSIISAAIPKM